VSISAIQITSASFNDLQAIQQLASTTFYESFAEMNTAADMKKYMDESFSTEKMSTELNDPFSEWYVAISNQQPVGYLKLNFGSSQTELTDFNAVEIERIYVLKAFHGKKIGQQLFDTAVEIAKNKNASYIWLGVWEHNHQALGFYKKNGLAPFGQHQFMLGDDKQTDIMMKREL
jgi:ribosomal protein S18 acetylase RimI-like enzyme